MTVPVPLTSFVGRAREVGAVVDLLREARLVTLTGAAGSGKTRLAIAVAERAPDGTAAWVDFAPLAEPALLPALVAAGIGAREEKDRRPIETLCAALRERPTLLVLDNCEHLAEACAALAETLLRECPGVRILATSREALGVGGERAWLVPLLPAGDSVALFVERAQAVHPGFALGPDNQAVVEAICRRLDGLPLAIELAAARVAVLGPAQILARLDEGLRSLGSGSRTAPPRQRTLRGAIDWSHALLGEAERGLLARLAVFPGSFSLTAVERICADRTLPVEEILDRLATLVEKSLVMMDLRAGEARYRLLEVVRQYALERLAASGDDVALRDRHAQFFLSLAEESQAHLLGYGAGRWTAVLADELPNLRGVFEWGASDPRGAEDALRMGAALTWFWIGTGQYAEGRARLGAALAHGARAGARARGHALNALAFLELSESDRSAVRPRLDESVRLLQGVGDAVGLATALLVRGMLELLEGAPGAGDTLAEAVTAARATGDDGLLVRALYYLGGAVRARGDLAAAMGALEEAAAVARRPGLELAFAYCAGRLGVLRLLAGDHAGAVPWLGEALAIHRQGLDLDRWGAVHVLAGVSGVAVAIGRPDLAPRLLGAADVLCSRMDISAPLDLREFHEHFIAVARGALEPPAFEQGWDAGMALDLESALVEATSVLADAPSRPARSSASAVARNAAPPRGPALRVHALGPLEILRDGAPLPATAWRAARPRELLLYLLCHRAGRTRDQIALVFWPDASPAQVKNNFHVALHHLRRALGRADLVIFDHERYRVHWEAGVEFDAAEFESDVRAALRPAAGGLDAARLRAALDRYRGDFLDGLPVGDWHLEQRDHLRRLFTDGLLALAGHDEGAERFADAADTYRRQLAADGLDEAAARGLMRCLGRLGDRAEALREFDRLTRVLKAELDAEPDPDTRALADQLRRAQLVDPPAAGVNPRRQAR